ncbi:DNA-binding transcriptional MerR regulator [Nocardiopsis sp. Huas11]|uniref:MerR family transcriptional regulator n=1 Tax=Nocardiopsis sp. Huas11 TaxID=2183912 RepID=UPI000EAB98A2|nr:MerR family transcriptional regulator [Nocardiopsis sp. Huas11]RKS07462.1 DNA-binding transcriptional MerR regulator [Nocardiopsis sp. Huas11]
MLTIGEAARLLGTTPRTLRFYHERGVVPEPGRDAQGYRRYGIETLHTLRRVLRLRDLGLPLDRCAALADAAHEDLGAALREWEEEIGRRERELRQRRLTIARLRADHERDRALGSGENQAAWARVLAEHGVAPDLIERETAAARLLSLFSEQDPLRGPAPSYGPDPERDGADVGSVMARFTALSPADLGTEEADRLVEDLVALALPMLSSVPAQPYPDAADTLAADLLSAFPPVQRRLLREVVLRLGAAEGSGGAEDGSREPDLP